MPVAVDVYRSSSSGATIPHTASPGLPSTASPYDTATGPSPPANQPPTSKPPTIRLSANQQPDTRESGTKQAGNLPSDNAASLRLEHPSIRIQPSRSSQTGGPVAPSQPGNTPLTNQPSANGPDDSAPSKQRVPGNSSSNNSLLAPSTNQTSANSHPDDRPSSKPLGIRNSVGIPNPAIVPTTPPFAPDEPLIIAPSTGSNTTLSLGMPANNSPSNSNPLAIGNNPSSDNHEAGGTSDSRITSDSDNISSNADQSGSDSPSSNRPSVDKDYLSRKSFPPNDQAIDQPLGKTIPSTSLNAVIPSNTAASSNPFPQDQRSGDFASSAPSADKTDGNNNQSGTALVNDVPPATPSAGGQPRFCPYLVTTANPQQPSNSWQIPYTEKQGWAVPPAAPSVMASA